MEPNDEVRARQLLALDKKLKDLGGPGVDVVLTGEAGAIDSLTEQLAEQREAARIEDKVLRYCVEAVVEEMLACGMEEDDVRGAALYLAGMTPLGSSARKWLSEKLGIDENVELPGVPR